MYVKKIARILIVLFLSLSPLVLQAEDVESLFESGNAAYSVGEYDKAIGIYKEIIAHEGSGLGLLYNLANSYAQKGQIGLAILNYERALKLSPSDPDIRGNLAKVRKDKGLFTKEPGKVARLFSTLSLDGWSTVAFGCLLFVVILLLIRLRYKSSTRTFALSTVSAVVLCMLSVAGTYYGYRSYNPLVVIANDIKLQVSPFEGATSTGTVVEGRLLFPVKQHGEYTYVTDRSGRKGWIKAEAVEAVCKI